MKPDKILPCMFLLLCTAAETLFCVAGTPPPPPPAGPFRHITLRLSNGAAINTGTLGELHLVSDSLLSIGSGERRLTVPLDQVNGWDIRLEENINTSTPSTEVYPARIRFSILPGEITIEGLQSDDIVTLYDTGGLSRVIRHDGNRLSLHTDALPRGMYIIMASDKSLKFMVQ